VIPNSAKMERTRLYASPLKLFGYMASGVPIIASDLPAIREVLDESTATFCEPDNPESLARAIEFVLANPAEAQTKARKALELVKDYSWTERARKILEFIG
jgi:glycosyltransferase involved in cell wall biosynthesis